MSTSGQVVRLRAPLIVDPYSQLPTKRDWTDPARQPLDGFMVDPGGSVETDLVNRTQIVTTPKLYGPFDADIEASDRVEAAGVVYEVDGHARVGKAALAGRPARCGS